MHIVANGLTPAERREILPLPDMAWNARNPADCSQGCTEGDCDDPACEGCEACQDDDEEGLEADEEVGNSRSPKALLKRNAADAPLVPPSMTFRLPSGLRRARRGDGGPLVVPQIDWAELTREGR